jgi:tRNA(fMet)-specific endonuclease VapC
LVTHGHPLRQLVLEKLEQDHQFGICVPILTEVLVGISLVSRAVNNLATWNRLKVQFRCHLLDETDAELAAELRIALRRRGWQLETVDALIASVALRYNLILLTADGDFDAVLTLQTENWLT